MTKNKNSTNKTGFLIFLIVLIGLVILGLIIYWFSFFLNQDNYQGKNGEYKIGASEVGNITFYEINVFFDDINYIYSFRNHPKDLEDIYLEPNINLKLNRPKGTERVFVTRELDLGDRTSGKSVLAVAAFEQILTGDAAIYNVNVTNTYTSFVRELYPVITCNNVTDTRSVIYLKIGDENKIYSEGDCVVIQGRGADGLVMTSEKFAYHLLGVF